MLRSFTITPAALELAAGQAWPTGVCASSMSSPTTSGTGQPLLFDQLTSHIMLFCNSAECNESAALKCIALVHVC